jgi:hypothetical protein
MTFFGMLMNSPQSEFERMSPNKAPQCQGTVRMLTTKAGQRDQGRDADISVPIIRLRSVLLATPQRLEMTSTEELALI